MTIVIWIFFFSLLLGQLGAIRIAPGVTVYIHDFAIAILLLTGLFSKKKTNSILPKLLWAIVVFGFVAFVSIVIHFTLWTQLERVRSLLYLGRWIYYSLLFLVVIRLTISAQVWLNGLYATGVGLALLGLVQFILYPSLANLSYLGWDPYYYRVFSTLLDPNFTGILFVLTFFLGFYLWKHSKRPVIIMSQLTTLIALVLTSSRSSFLSLGAGVITYCFIKRQWIWMLGFAVLIGVYVVIPKPAMEAFRLDRSVSANARVGNWQQSIKLFQKEPIVGLGFGNRRLIKSDAHIVEDVPSNAGSGIDSSILFALATTGVVGLLAYINLFKNILILFMQATKKTKTSGLGMVGIVWIASLLVHSLFTNSLFYPWVMIFLWIFLGVVQRQITSDS